MDQALKAFDDATHVRFEDETKTESTVEKLKVFKCVYKTYLFGQLSCSCFMLNLEGCSVCWQVLAKVILVQFVFYGSEILFNSWEVAI